MFSRLKILFWQGCLCALLFSSTALQAQERMHAGVELDVLPYLTGGYFGAAWFGKEHLRARGLFAKVNMPEFMVPSGFKNNTIQSYAILTDFFLKKEQKGWWMGAGFVFWDGKIQCDQQPITIAYKSYLLNGSVGYVVNLGNRFYLSPWAGTSLRVGGDQDIILDQKIYDPPVFNPELSLKFGFRIM